MSDWVWAVDWHGLVAPTHSLFEMVIRGTVMYFIIFGLMRVVMKRQSGGIGTTDVLVVVLLAEVAGNGFSADYRSMTEGAVLVGTVLFWSYSIEWLAHRFAFLERLLRPQTVLLVEDGRMLRKNMRAELVTQEELMAQMRENGVEDIEEVKRACMEADGTISVITKSPRQM